MSGPQAHHVLPHSPHSSMTSQWASPLSRGQPSQVRSPDYGRYPQLRTWRRMVEEWGHWEMTAWNTGSRAMGSMRPEALFPSSSTSRYGSAQVPPGRYKWEMLGPGIDGREGDRI